MGGAVREDQEYRAIVSIEGDMNIALSLSNTRFIGHIMQVYILPKTERAKLSIFTEASTPV